MTKIDETENLPCFSANDKNTTILREFTGYIRDSREFFGKFAAVMPSSVHTGGMGMSRWCEQYRCEFPIPPQLDIKYRGSKMGMNGAAVLVVNVIEELTDDGWHRLTSPQIAGLCLIGEDGDLDRLYAALPEAIAELIADGHANRRAKIKLLKNYQPNTHLRERPEIRTYAVDLANV